MLKTTLNIFWALFKAKRARLIVGKNNMNKKEENFSLFLILKQIIITKLIIKYLLLYLFKC